MLIIFNTNTVVGLKEKCFNFVFVITSIPHLYEKNKLHIITF